MTVHTHCLVLPSTYRDSVALLQLSQTLEQLPEVQRVAVMMGTPRNKALLQEAGLFTTAGEQGGTNDLLICVQANTAAAVEHAMQEAKRRLAERQGIIEPTGAMAPRTLETALRCLPEANLACISVPGQYAAYEARKALRHGLHVFLFSAHVALEVEAKLKQLAAQCGLLLMGPDCGTAILNGVPVGFANQVLRGPVGLVSASGTGLQQVVCLLAQQGIGVSQAIGVGGRDMHQHIGGRSMRAALQALACDAGTQVIVLISKPPAAAVAARLVREAALSGKPCVLALLGETEEALPAHTVYPVATLEDAAAIAAALAHGQALPAGGAAVLPSLAASLDAARAQLQPGQRVIHALYCGGTMAYEALRLLRQACGAVHSNLDGTLPPADTPGHAVLDLGAEEFTSGRPHPMIDPAVRHQQLLAIAQQPNLAVVLCDVMLGWGAHPDPAGALVAAWQEAQARAQAVGRCLVGVATVCGTPHDPQGYERQCRVLQEHGFFLAASNAQAVRFAVAVVDGQDVRAPTGPLAAAGQMALADSEAVLAPAEVPANLPALFATGPRVINIGLELFTPQLMACGVPVVQVDWRPPAGGDVHLLRMLERLR
jgi:FdrA protein